MMHERIYREIISLGASIHDVDGQLHFTNTDNVHECLLDLARLYTEAIIALRNTVDDALRQKQL